MSISPNLIFHIDGLDSLIKSWEKLNILFDLKKEIQAYHLENVLLTLVPSNFSSIEYFLSKIKTLTLLLEGCKVKNEDDNLISGILSKLGLVYSIFASTFHPTREALFFFKNFKYKAPSFYSLCDFLIRKQEKLLHLRLIKYANTSNKSTLIPDLGVDC